MKHLLKVNITIRLTEKEAQELKCISLATGISKTWLLRTWLNHGKVKWKHENSFGVFK